MEKLRTLLVFGTRPEAIKMSPVVRQCRSRTDAVDPIVCVSGQHREMLAPLIQYFDIRPDLELDLMQPNQSLAGLTARCLEAFDQVMEDCRPDCVVAQGDTTTAMAVSMIAFYRRVPLVHVEAGLRTHDLSRPWPEEFNRRIADMVAGLHCAPTQRAADALLTEGVPADSVHVTGNTVIDALLEVVGRERDNRNHWRRKYAELGDRPMILITAHRRESFGQDLANICQAIGLLADRFSDHVLVFPVHPNPSVFDPVHQMLKGRPNVWLADPVPYPEFVWLMDRSKLILTDSGGIQEEAPSLGKPVVVMREVTERLEVLSVGAARLVGTSVHRIVDTASALLSDAAQSAACLVERNPYGDGHAAERIVDLMLRQGWR